MKVTYVFGHKVPDTDSVCSSISLSYLKNQLGFKTEPRVLGDINKETKFVLDYFGFKEPEFLNDVKVRIRDMKYNKNAMVEEDVSIYEAYDKLAMMGVTGLPLINSHKKLTGYVNVKEISKYLIEGDVTYLDTSYDNIIKTLGAYEVLRFDDEIEGHVLAAAYKSETFLNRVKLDNNDILLVGDRYKIQEYAVESGIKLLLLVNNVSLPDNLLEIAKKNKVNVIRIPMGTFKSSNMIKLCNYVRLINIQSRPVSFTNIDYRDDFVEVSNRLGHTNYPVITRQNVCVGMLRLVDSNNYEKQQVILVDHNQKDQSVDGLEEANILEIIDHHNLGTLGTSSPINFRSMPVGCTSTIIYKLYEEAHVEIPKNIAGLMLSAILSDTLLFKSPTTTELDKEVADKLSKIVKLDVHDYGMKMFKAASSIAGLSAEEIINTDTKSYKFEDSSLSISQIMTMDFEEISKRKDEFVGILNSMCNVGNYKYALLFVTDIINNGSYIFYNDKASELLLDAYRLDHIEQGLYLDGVVSRKKQMLPPLLDNQK